MSVDDRIVSMTFDNEEFERRIGETLRSLDDLSEAIRFTEGHKGFAGLSAAADSVNISSMADGIDNISSKFGALGAIGFTAISKITGGILDFVKNTSGDILGPIISGGKTRAENIEQAKFKFRGLGIDVQAAMDSALAAVKGTAYGLDEAAKIAAQFGASGIKAGDGMTSSLRAVAGAAAMTGSSFTEIGDIFAQSAALGKVTGQDLNQFATRGLNAAAAIAKVLGKTEAEVRQMASSGQLSFQTFSDAMDKAFGANATKANETYSGSLANVKAALSRLGASYFGPRLEQQRDLFNALTPVIDNVTKAMKPLIDVFLKASGIGTEKIVAFLGNLKFENFNKGIETLSKALQNVFTFLGKIGGIAKDAFRDIFPPSTTSLLVTITDFLFKLSEKLKMGGETAENVKSIFRGFFSALAIGFEVIKGVAVVVASLFGALFKALNIGDGGGALKFFANLGESLAGLKAALVDGGGIKNFFAGLAAIITGAFTSVEKFKDGIVKLFNGGEIPGAKGAADAIDKVGDKMGILASLTDRLKQRLTGFSDGVGRILGEVWEHIKKWFGSLGSDLAAELKPGDFDAAVDVVNVGLLGGIAVMLKRFLDGGIGIDLTGGIFEKIGGVLDGFTGKLEAMQAKLKAEALMKIAIAVGVLAASMTILAMIDSADLTKALSAMAAGFGQLVGTMAVLSGIAAGPKGAAKLNLLVAAMIGLAGAMVILSLAIKILSTLNPGEMATALAGMAGGIAAMVIAVNLMTANPAAVLSGSLAMIAIATALAILAGAMKLFATMSWEEIAKGLTSVGIGLGIIVIAMNLMPIGATLAAGLAMIPLAIGITILAGAVKLFADMSWGEMLKGMVGLGAALLIIAGAMHLMPLTLPLTAAGLVLVAVALNGIALAVRSMGSMDLGTLAKGIGSIAIMLGLLVVALHLMNGTAPGAAALIVAAGALVILTHVLKTLGEMKILDIVKGLAAIAAVFLVLGVAATLLAPTIPAMLALAVALGLIGAAFALFGAGAYMIGKAFEMLAKAGVTGMKALVEAMKIFITALPLLVGAFARAIIELAAELLRAAPMLLGLITVLLLKILDTVIVLVPKIAEAIGAIVSAAIILLQAKWPELLIAGFQMLMQLLKGIRDNIVEIVTLATEIVVKFTTALAENAPKLVEAAAKLLLAFLTAIAEKAADVVAAGLNILVQLLKGISDNLFKVVAAGAEILANLIRGIADNVHTVINAGIDAILKFIRGISENIWKVTNAAVDVAIAFVKGISDNAIKFANAAADALISFLNGLANAIREKAPQIRDAGGNIASAILEGITGGLNSGSGGPIGTMIGLAGKMAGGFMGAIRAKSPSKMFEKIAGYITQGLAMGIDKDTLAENSAVVAAERIVAAFEETLNKVPDSLAGLGDLNPVITPVLDLTKVQSASKNIDRLMTTTPITAEVSYDKARLIAKTTELEPTAGEAPAYDGPREIKFEQNNYSPAALSTNDVYRNTKSQIALAKEELSIP